MNFFVWRRCEKLEINPDFTKDISKMKISAETANRLAGITEEDFKPDLHIKALDQLLVGVASDKSSVNAYQSIHKDLLEGIQQEK